MEDKNKKNNNQNPIEEEKDEKKQENIEDEVIEKIVNELEEKYNIKKENIKIVKLKQQTPRQRIKSVVFKEFFFWLFDFLLILALHGYFSLPETDILKILLFSAAFYIIETSGRVIIDKYFRKLILYSFGTIMLPITIIALVLAQLVSGVEMSEDIILFVIVFITVRIILRFILMRKEILTVIQGRKK